MEDTSQKRALEKYRKRLSEHGLARFEVLGLHNDRNLIRSLAKRLAENSPEATRIRTAIAQTIAGEPSQRGRIVNALRRSPLVGVELDLKRPRDPGRGVDL